MQKELGGLIITKLDNAILCYFIKKTTAITIGHGIVLWNPHQNDC